ncbi:uncharacterized protein LOC143015569 isoform X2 [Genypterus blacodes]|uniref:uncharacterized protein LOC143015569 isoform X2 n=1 Tax=Genypterus blacodes TaxID=154954 RepID=UPI003F75FC0E
MELQHNNTEGSNKPAEDVEATRRSMSGLSKPNQGTPRPGGVLAALVLNELRTQQLHTRRAVLLKMKEQREDGSSTEELESELEAIEEELQELQERKEALQGEQDLTQEVTTSAPAKDKIQPETPSGPLVPVDRLSHTPALTQCPSCYEVVTTETSSKVSDVMWALCCVSSLLGLRDVRHQCPRCRADIWTHQLM